MSDLITMSTPIVEMDGDEMARVMWSWVKETLLNPHVDLRTEYYDLGLANRNQTDDAVTTQAANATMRLGVAVKCATITANTERVAEYQLKRVFPSPNATIRAILDGTVFRTPIIAGGIQPYIANWAKPITIARHAYGDVYKAVELAMDDDWMNSRVELVATRSDGQEQRLLVHDFTVAGETSADSAAPAPTDGAAPASSDSLPPSSGIVQGMHNTDASIRSFARACLEYALARREDLWFSAKDTISKIYDRRFRDIFAAEADLYADRFAEAGISYNYTLIDDAVARVIRSTGGFIWATKNYDGDVMSDMVATAFGSLAMMSSVLVSPHGHYEFEAAHGTVQRHYYRYLEGETTFTNPVAIIFAWTGALGRRGRIDGNADLVQFAARLEQATLMTIADGLMTPDLAAISNLDSRQELSTQQFLHAVASRL